MVFIHGQRFALGGSGLAQRTRLAFDALTLATQGRPRFLLSPDYPEVRALAEQAGWTLYPVGSWLERQNAAMRLSLRLASFWGALVHAGVRDRLFTMLGGADVAPGPVNTLLGGLPQADIWLSRCDLLHLTRCVRPGQRVILDSNDTVANLVECYDPRRRVRRLSGLSKAKVVSLIAAHEVSLARRCDRIIAISPEDERFYRQAAPSKVVLEESCVVTPPDAAPSFAERRYDVGFLGGSHQGSVDAARNFLRLSAHPLLRGKRFALAGGICGMVDKSAAGAVEMLGRVESSRAFLGNCRQVLLWSQNETGTSVKFQEAVLSGASVIANAPAARWSQARAGRDYFLCETESEVVPHILSGSQIQSSALLEQCRPDVIAARFARLLAA
ncbi:MAG: hypothetical protein H7067_16375 [Burkholderiales bacterium]|nr:hypothetical protein [Opitutaceae bacterium]